MLKIGLTGGIGSGKSVVAKYFAKLSIPIIDADKIAHELLCPHTTTYKKIVAHFGMSLLTTQKLINRKKLRDIIFTNPKERQWLEKTLHPRIRSLMQQYATKLKAPYCIMVIPLLFETKFPIKTDRILVIDCPPNLQIKRVHKRDHSSTTQVRAIIKAQASRTFRFNKADDIIHNDGSLKHLEKSVKILHSYYLSLA